jgi:hypothetical protein
MKFLIESFTEFTKRIQKMNELIEYNNGLDKNDMDKIYFISLKGKLYLLEDYDDIPDDIKTEIFNDTNINIENEDVIFVLSKEYNILCGYVEDDYLYIFRGNNHSYRLDSKDVLKVKQHFKCKYVNYTDSNYGDVINRESIRYVYHGTDYESAVAISKEGIKRNHYNKNHDISNNEYIYFSSDLYVALYQSMIKAKNNKTLPAIIRIDYSKLDKDLFIEDFDVIGDNYNNLENFFHIYPNLINSTYMKYRNKEGKIGDFAKNISDKLGVYGYKGDINPQRIEDIIMIDNDELLQSYIQKEQHGEDYDFKDKLNDVYNQTLDDYESISFTYVSKSEIGNYIDDNNDTCDNCNGFGVETCIYCDGGDEDCEECNGTNDITCTDCDGTGVK